TPPAVSAPVKGVADLIETPEQAFIALSHTLRKVGLRLVYANDGSTALPPNPESQVKRRLMASWAAEMNRVVVDRDQYEQMQHYLGGVKLASIRAQIATDDRITGQVAPRVWQPPLPPSLDPD
ncbi:hypothetical protein KEM55_000370, partial [Ascosphaera atra]